MSRSTDYHLAVNDFQSAHLRGKLQGVLARLTGKSNQLLSYEEVASKLRLQGRSDKGLQSIPVDAVVGSVGRYTDFTRTFLPRRAEDQERWARVKAATVDPVGQGLQPITVYKVSDVYFVIDGNHRVSIARQEGWKTIEAHVIEVQTDIPLTPDIRADELIAKAEYAEFLEQTGLKRAREPVDLRTTIPGGYQRLLDEICALQERREGGTDDCVPADSAERWYHEIYLPFAEAVRERGMMRWFPDRTITDLYVWMAGHRAELEKELGWSIRPEAAAEVAVQQRSRRASAEEARTGSWRKARLLRRYTEHLFRDILVPLRSSPESWQGLDQAVRIARREDANILALHTVESRARLEDPEVGRLQEQFKQICAKEDVRGVLAVEVGEPAQKILERSALTDIIVLKITYPPTPGLRVLTSPIYTLLARASRPILAVPGEITDFRHALVAFDGSPKAKEALFVAAYLAEQWKTELTILTGLDDRVRDTSVQDFARSYLEFNEVEARYLDLIYSPERLKAAAEEVGADLVIMGGYSGSVLKEMTIGSSVNFMLREAKQPLFICR